MKRTEVIVGLVSVLMLMLPILSSTLAASTNTTTTTKSEDEASMSKSNQAFTNQSRREEGQGENKEPFGEIFEKSAKDFAIEIKQAVESLKCSLGFCPGPRDNSTTEATPAAPVSKKPTEDLNNKPVADKQKPESSEILKASTALNSSTFPEGTHPPETTNSPMPITLNTSTEALPSTTTTTLKSTSQLKET